jgi:hypothetical protein
MGSITGKEKEKSIWTAVRALFPQHVVDHFPVIYARLMLPLLPAATPEAAAAAAAAAADEAAAHAASDDAAAPSA